MRSTACVWAGVCAGDKACLERCPVAVAIAGKESNFDPWSRSYDMGMGLWNVGVTAYPPSSKVASWAPCDKIQYNDNTKRAANGNSCPAMNPFIEGEWIKGVTDGGNTFAPKGNCWSVCTSKCNSASHLNHVGGSDDNYTKGWVTPALATPGSGGA